MIFERLIKEISKDNANIFRITLFENGIWNEKMLLPTPKLLNCYSLAKNFTATAIGIAQDKCLLNVDNLILDYFTEELPDYFDKKLKIVKIRHLLTQTTGNEKGYFFDFDRSSYKERNYLKVFLSQPLKYEPGVRFVYSNSNYYLLSLIIHRVSGLTLEAFLRKYLFSSMDIHEYAWQNCPMEETLGATGLFMSTIDLAKLGVLYLNNGQYEGHQLLSTGWIRESMKDQVNLPDTSAYGYSFWIKENSYFGTGSNSQILLVLPEQKLVLAAHAFVDYYDYTSLLNKIL